MSKLTFGYKVTLRDGNPMPVIGYSSVEHEYNVLTQTEIFEDAIKIGYRYFDLDYDDDCLRPLRRAIERSGIDRAEFFVACRYGKAQNRIVPGAGTANELMEQFGGKLDLISLSWPYYYSMSSAWSGMENYEKTMNGYPQGMQDCYPEIFPEIGVCNFDIKHMESLKQNKNFKMLPLVNQNQFHPLYGCPELREYCKENHIIFVKGFENNDAVSVNKPYYATDVSMNGELFEISEREKKANELGMQMYTTALYKKLIEQGNPQGEEMFRERKREVVNFDPYDSSVNPRTETDFYEHCKPIRKLGEKYGKTNRQVIDRWALQNGAVILVRGIWKEEMEAGKNIFDFELNEEEMRVLDKFDMNKRFGYHPDYIDF